MRKTLEVLCTAAFVAFACITIVVITARFEPGMGMLGNPLMPIPNVCIALAVVVGMFAARHAWRSKRFERLFPKDDGERAERHYLYASYIVPVCLLGVQVVVYALAGIETGWDVSAVVETALIPKDELAGNPGVVDYFSRCTNNLFLLWVLRGAGVVRRELLPFLAPKDWLAIVSCLSSALSCFLFMRIARKVFDSVRCASLAVALYVALVGLSPWYMIPYTDSFGLLCCTAMLWCGMCGRSRWVRWPLLALLAGVSLAMKPSTVFVFVAVVVVRIMTHKDALQLAGATWCAAATIVGLCSGIALTRGAVSTLPIPLDENARFTAWHFAMVGCNPSSDGRYTDEDVEYSTSFATVQEREEGNRRKILQRVSDMGPVGIASLLYRKTLVNYNSGIFSWGSEGDFIISHKPLDTQLAKLLADYLYEGWPLYGVFDVIQQTLWVIVLVGIPLGLLGVRRSKESLDKIAILLASVFTLTLFVLIFEARGRYLYMYGSFYVLLAVWGYLQFLGKTARNDTLMSLKSVREANND